MKPLRIFLSYPSSRHDVAESLFHELRNAGHQVFFDKSRLEPGKPFSPQIQDEILACDLFLFLITPDSVAEGRYTRTELRIARDQWASPPGIVLPVMLEDTPVDAVPAFLKSCHIFRPEGNAAAEIALEVARLAAERSAAAPVPPPPEPPDETALVYSPLQLRFAPEDHQGYAVSVAESPSGVVPGSPFPIDPDAVSGMLWAAGGEAVDTARRAARVPGELLLPALMPSEVDARRAGQALYQALFAPPLADCLETCLRTIDPQRGAGLRFLINTTEAPGLAGLPWEFLYDPRHEDFVFSDRMKPVVRWLDLDQPTPTLAVKPPLRLLIAIAAPPGHAELAVGEELRHLDHSLTALVETGLVRTRQVDHATLERLDQALVDERPHVLHFIGHGDFQGEDGAIMLEAEGAPGDVDPVTGRRLAALLRNHLGSLRLVFLNSCQGSTVSRRDPFGGVAQNLIRRGVPAVIAMQFAIPDAVAVALARHFYRYLASGLPVDAALTAARAFLYAKGHAVEWGAPALHMRTPDGRLFDFAAAGARPPAPVSPPAEPAEERPVPKMQPAEPFPPPSEAIPEPSPAMTGQAERGIPSRPAAASRGVRVGPVALGLIVVLAVGIGFFAVFDFGDEAIAPGVPPPAERPPAAANGAPPPTAEPEPTPAPFQAEADELVAAYRDALELFAAGEMHAALERLEEHGIPTPEAAALVPQELRDRTIDLLQDTAIAAASQLDRPAFSRIAAALLATEPDAAARQLMAKELEHLYEMFSEPLTATPEPPAPAPEPPAPAPEPSEPAPTEPVPPPTPAKPAVPAEQITPVEPSLPPVPTVPEVPRPVPEPEPIPRNGAPTPTPVAQVLYTVQRGDTLWAIAARHYGDPLLWPVLHHANRALVPNPHHIRPGQQLLLPALPPEHVLPGGTLRVLPGDSLWRIAARIYGDPLSWPEIHAANATTIPDPDRILPGQILVLPR